MPAQRLEPVVKKTYGYRERDELRAKRFQEQLKSKSASQIVYVDGSRHRQS